MRQIMKNTWEPGTVPMPDPGRVSIRESSLLHLVAMAYRVPEAQVKAPAWMDEQSFDVEAKLPDGAPVAQVNEMLQSLLRDRFALAIHHETKDLAGYALIQGKGGSVLKESVADSGSAATGDKRDYHLRATLQARAMAMLGAAGSDPNDPRPAHVERKHISAGQLASWLANLAHAPVVDTTGLRGTYDVELDIAQNPEQGPTLFQAVEKLGLKLELRKVPTDIIVVDKSARTPSPN
jgi:uncharacterized protein (TIGR03435 family)